MNQGRQRARGDGRQVAAEVLLRVAKDDAYAAAVLDRAVQKAGLDGREAGLATQISYGTLRVLPTIDATLGRALHRPERPVEPWAMAVMRCAAFELLHMRSASHAVVHRAVELAKSRRSAKLGSFVNGVLRKVANARPDQPQLPLHVELPGWLSKQLASDLSEQQFEAFQARPLPPPTSVAVLDAEMRDELRAQLVRRGAAGVEVHDFPPSAISFREGGDLRQVPSEMRSTFRVMELGSQIVAASVPLRAGMRVADCCAGRGGKTILLAKRVGSSGEVHALELHDKKLRQIGRQTAQFSRTLREQLAPITLQAIDLSVGAGGLDESFDVAFVDLPCSGTGTLHRRPELLLRLTPERVVGLTALQEKIALHCAALVRSGGTLVVAVCSVLAAEGSALRRRLAACLPDFEPRTLPQLDAICPLVDGVYRLGPWHRNADGFQMFALRRSA